MEFASIARGTVAKVIRLKTEKVPGKFRALTKDKKKKKRVPHNKIPIAHVKKIIAWCHSHSTEVPDEFRIRRFSPPCVSKAAAWRLFTVEEVKFKVGITSFKLVLRRCCPYIKVNLTIYLIYTYTFTNNIFIIHIIEV